MARLSEVLGAIMSEVANARRIADQQSVRIAEAYRQEPLLRDMTPARVRLREVSVDLPVLIEGVDPAVAAKPAPPAALVDSASRRFEAMLSEAGMPPAEAAVERFRALLTLALERVAFQDARPRSRRIRAAYAEATSSVVTAVVNEHSLPAEFAARAAKELQSHAAENAVWRPGDAESMRVEVSTGEVKTRADPQNITRLRIVLREEGLEWHEVQAPDGTTSSRLTPE